MKKRPYPFVTADAQVRLDMDDSNNKVGNEVSRYVPFWLTMRIRKKLSPPGNRETQFYSAYRRTPEEIGYYLNYRRMTQ